MNAPTTPEPTGVSVRHDARVAALVALLAAVLTVAWFARALGSANPLDWAWCLVPAAVGLLQLLVVRDARTPLLVADELGVRVRRGRTWHGVQWPDVDRVEVRSGGRLLADGRLVVHPRDRSDGPFVDGDGHDGDGSTGATPEEPPVLRALSVPLGPTTRIDYDGLTGDLVADLDALGQGRVPVLVLTRAVREADVPANADRGLLPVPVAEPVDERVGAPVADLWSDDAVDVVEQVEQPLDPDHQDGDRQDDQDDQDDQDGLDAHARHEPSDLEDEASAGSDAPGRTARRWAHDLRARARARALARAERSQSPAATEQPDQPDQPDQTTGPAAPEQVTLPPEEPARAAPEQAAAEPDQAEEPAPVEPEEGVGAYEPVDPSRAPRPAARAEVVRDAVRRLPDPPAVPAQRRPGGPVVVARIDDVAPAADPAAHLVVDQAGDRAGVPTVALPGEVGDEVPHPVAEPVIGPLVAAARHRARLSIDTLSERTRIRPHVLECIEVDDFAACGGDFYARGHLRTLARVFGLDPAELLALHDRHYAAAEIQARQVFEAELATGIGGGVRTATSGPRWSLLAASVLALVGVWGVARAFNDTPQELVSPAPDVVDVAGLASGEEPTAAPESTLAALSLTARGASPQVVVRDRDGKILLAARLADGAQQQVIGLAPFDVTSSNGAAVAVTYLGRGRGTVGESEQPDNRQFG